MPALSTLHDPELGSIVLRPDTRARRLTFRMRDGRLHVSLPPGTPVAEVRKAVDQLRPRLKTMRGAGSLPLIDTDYRIDTDFFHLSLTEGTGSRFLARGEVDRLQIICPTGTDFRNAELQAWLRKVIVEALRHRAKAILPPRLGELARRHGLFSGENPLIREVFCCGEAQSAPVSLPCPVWDFSVERALGASVTAVKTSR